MTKNYTVYHLHTEQSLLDSCTNYKLYVDKAKELGQTAICFTEHGVCYSWISKKLYCDEHSIKYMHGVEIYLTEQLEPKVRDNFHTILIAKNYEGIKELNQLIYQSTQPDHFYYKPRISFDEFFNISDNIIKISACLASPLNRLRYDSTKHNVMRKLVEHYDFLEVQPHNTNEQNDYNNFLLKVNKKYHTPLIVGTDTHSIDNYKAECRTILQLAKRIEFQDEDTYDLTYKTYDELYQMFVEQNVLSVEQIETALENTNKMAEMVESFDLDMSFKYPILYNDEKNVLWETLRKKFKEKLDNNIINRDKIDKYTEQIKEEMRVFEKIGMVGFILFMSEMSTWCRENNIPTGFCRGSVGGSVVCYIADIIDVDPIKWHTVFSRFCNEDRTEIGDIDMDFSPDQRELVYQYIIDRFGKEKTAYILASGTVSEKGTIDEIGRALALIWSRENNEGENPWSLSNVKQIKDDYEINPERTRELYPDLFYYYDGIINTVVSQSMHPAGIVASPINLIENYCCFNNEGKNILSINMEECHEISLVKYDILGLKNIQVIRNTCEYANINYPLSHTINWNDEKVWQDIITSPIGIFQFESDFAFKSLQTMKPNTVNEMSLVNAGVRPSGTSYRDKLFNREQNIYEAEPINELLKDSFGWLVYQETTIQFLQEICGLSGSEADNIRRAIGRKQKDRLDQAMPSILEGYCSKSNHDREKAELEAKQFLQIIEDSSSYQFGYNHSLGYTMISYTCGMLRYYYPLEFTTALLNNANNDEDIISGTTLARQKGITLYTPKFRKSSVGYTFDKETNSIYKGIDSIKYLNVTVAENLYNLRNTPLTDFVDVLYYLKENGLINVKQLDILIRLDYFKEFGNINYLLEVVKIFDKFYKCKTLKKTSDANLWLYKKYSQKETEKTFSGIDNKGLITEMCEAIKDIPSPTLSEMVAYQVELLGYADIIDETAEPSWYIVEKIETNQWGNSFITLYQLNSGIRQTMKVAKKWYEEYPCDVGNILNAVITAKERYTKLDGATKTTPTGEFEMYLKLYSILN